MRSNILNYINKLQSYKTAIKNLHWSSKRMSEHKLLDDIADSVAENQDEIAEIAQGIYGKIKNNELKPRRYKIIDSRKMIEDLTKDTKEFHSTINGKELIGLRSVVESFIGELNKFKYLMVMCVKEDFKRNYKEKQLNENNYKSRYHKMMAAKHAAGLDSETARNEMSNYFAKQQAIRDINKHRSVSTMDDHEREFNNQINGDTFDVDFRDLDLYGESKIRISENELRSVIREAIDNTLKKKVNEVRYIDTNNRYKKNLMDVYYKQEPIKNGESIRVFHGCNLETAINACINGLSGQVRVPRKYSYENCMNPKGLFVTTDFNVAKDFAYDVNTMVIIEFTANSNDLDTPVWNDSYSYFGQGSNPKPFSNREEREKQKQAYKDAAKNSEYSYVRDSDNPAMAERIFSNNEHQALFVGNLNPNQIKRFWVNKNGDRTYIPLSRKDFYLKFGNSEVKYNDYSKTYSKIYKEKAFLPNEDFTSIEDMVRRDLENHFQRIPSARKRINAEERIKEDTIDYENALKDALETKNYDILYDFESFLYPKQMKQLFGDEIYNELYGHHLM